MSNQKNVIAANSGTSGNVGGGALNQIASMTQAALDADANSDINSDIDGGYAEADLDQTVNASGSEDNTSMGDFTFNL